MERHTNPPRTKSCSQFLRATGAAFAALTVFMCGAGASAQFEEPQITIGGQGETSKELILALGKTAIVDLPRPVADVVLANPATVDAVVRTPRRVFLMARTPGITNAFFFDRNNDEILNLEIRIEPDARAVTEMIERVMPDARVTVESLNGNIVLHGQVDTPIEAQRIEDLARVVMMQGGAQQGGGGGGGGGGMMIPQVISMLSVRQPAQVMLKVRIVEMERRLIRQLGIDLDGVAQLNDAALTFAARNSFAISGSSLGGLSGTVQTPGFGEIDNLDYAFDLFEQNGLVKTLAEPTLVAMSGFAADFLAGGEFPVPEAGELGVPSVSFKQFGVQLEFRPQVFSKGRIQLELRTEVSDVSFATGLSFGANQFIDAEGNVQDTEGFVVPGTTSRSASTTIELPSGGSIAIAGLLQEDISDFVDGVPGLKETPVLGALFRSQEFQRNQTELVIIATPFLVEPTDLANLTDPAAGHVSPTAVQSLLLGKLESAYGVQREGVSEAGLEGPLGFILD